MTDKGSAMWPKWPPNATPTRLVDVKVSCSANTLFLLLWEPDSPYVVKAQTAVGNKDYTETQWDPSEDSLVSGSHGSAPPSPRRPAEYKGLRRMNKCSSQGMGLKFFNEEMQRCTVASEGGPFEVELVVYTTATYGERFRPVIVHKILPLGPNTCNYIVEYVLVFIQSTNSLLKRAIDRGVSNGVTKNFGTLVELLSQFHPVKPMTAGDTDESNMPITPPEPVAQQVEASLGTYTPAELWTPLVSHTNACHLSLPAQRYITALSTRVGVPESHAKAYGASVMAALLVALLAALTLTGLSLLQKSLLQLPGIYGRIAGYIVLALLPLPSFWHVLLAVLIVWLANLQLSAILCLFVPAPAAQPLQPRTSRVSRDVRVVTAEVDHPEGGIRYDGYDISLEEAATRIAEGELELRKVVPRAQANSDLDANKNAMKSLRFWVDPTQWFSPSEPSPRPGSQPARPSITVSPSPAQSPSKDSSQRPQKSLKSEAGKPKTSRLSKKPEEAERKGQDESVPGKLASEEVDGRTSAGGFRDLLSPTGLMGKTESMFTGWSGSGKPKPAPPISIPAEQRRDSSQIDYEAQEEAATAKSITELTDLTDIVTEDTSKPKEEEVFENERLQPFRGFGHQWPGHFLPTDRVGHWSRRLMDPLHSVDAFKFDSVAPQLKKGWEWVEDSWAIDMDHVVDCGVDENGWTYATDFRTIEWPPKPGCGRFRKVRDFVRRRRWKRTRVFAGIPLQEASPSRPALLGISPPGNPVSMPLGSQAASEVPETTEQAESRDASPLQQEAAAKSAGPNAAPPPRPFPPDLLSSLAAELAEGRKPLAASNGLSSSLAQKPELTDRSVGKSARAMNGAQKEQEREKEKNIMDMLMFMGKKDAESKSEFSLKGKDLERRDSESSEKSNATMKSFTDKMSSGFSSMFAGASFSGFAGKKDEHAIQKESQRPFASPLKEPVKEHSPTSRPNSARLLTSRRSISEELADPLKASDLISHIIIKQGRDRGIHRRFSEADKASESGKSETSIPTAASADQAIPFREPSLLAPDLPAADEQGGSERSAGGLSSRLHEASDQSGVDEPNFLFNGLDVHRSAQIPDTAKQLEEESSEQIGDVMRDGAPDILKERMAGSTGLAGSHKAAENSLQSPEPLLRMQVSEGTDVSASPFESHLDQSSSPAGGSEHIAEQGLVSDKLVVQANVDQAAETARQMAAEALAGVSDVSLQSKPAEQASSDVSQSEKSVTSKRAAVEAAIHNAEAATQALASTAKEAQLASLHE